MTAIHPCHDLETLLGELLAALARQRGESPKPVTVVVPSVHLREWLQLAIARRTGICMGLEFPMPGDFINKALALAQKSGKRPGNPWSKERLTWRILPHVGSFARQLGLPEEAAPREQLAAAALVADQLDQYGHFRPELIRHWSTKGPGDWQGTLWTQLAAETEVPHPALLLEPLPEMKETYPELIVLGTGAIDPLLVRVLSLFSASGSNVHIHIVLPSLDFLGDQNRRKLLPATDLDPEEIKADAGHPLLVSMGRHAVGAFLLLGELDDQYDGWPPFVPSPPRGASLLSRLQDDIRNLRAPVLQPAQPDASLRVHSCFGPRREMEVLRDELLRAFAELPNLQPEEVVVVAPSLEAYAPLVRGVLQTGAHGLRVCLMELPAAEQDPLLQALLTLLEIARSGRYEASWLLELLRMEAVQVALGIKGNDEALERVRGWVRDTGLTQGLEAGPGSWEFSRNRLIAGHWFGQASADHYPDGSFVLPVADPLAGQLELRQKFIRFHAGLQQIFKKWEILATAAQWAERLQEAYEALFGSGQDNQALQPHLAFLRDQKCEVPLDAGAILDWLHAETEEEIRRGKLNGGLLFGRFKQLQHFPCRVLAMVGMHEGEFPGQNRVPAWDLLKKEPKVWDRNPRVNDRQLFLDALLTVKDRLIITASNRNIRSGEHEPFSACVDELLRVTAAMGAPKEGLVLEHRLQPFAAGYFTGTPPLPASFSAKHAAVAQGIRSSQKRTTLPFWEQAAGSGEELRELTLRELAGFWKDPAWAFLKAQGIALPRREEQDELLDQAPLSLEGFQAWHVKNSILQAVVSGAGDLSQTRAQLGANRALPPGEFAQCAWETNLQISEPIGKGIREQLGLPRQLSFEFQGTRITGSIELTKDEKAILVYRPGSAKAARHFLEPWIYAVCAGCAGLELPTMYFSENHPGQSNLLKALNGEEARGILATLLRGYRLGQRAPLPFGVGTSDCLAKTLAKKPVEQALAAAQREWFQEAGFGAPDGEGRKDGARLAWRDLDAFADTAAWLEWAQAVSQPLRNWGGF